ncbi:MAG: DUF3800 domain-containing protein [Acidobacteria bacterium]|nr:DUF3800 domain-containing protein [Acidobacteriota bacterium]
MHLLYLDESGLAADSKRRHFVLAGLSVFERSPHWIEAELDSIAARFNRDDPRSVELHGSPMRTGAKFWRNVPLSARERAIKDALDVAVTKRCRLFGAVLEKSNHSGQDVTQVAFEQVSSRFDQYLGRLHRQDDTQRGLILFDKCAVERRIQTMARDFKSTGHTFGRLRNLAEVPVFIDSEASRLIQLADLVAYALFRHHEFNDSTYYDVIRNSFDSEGGVVHGLYHR